MPKHSLPFTRAEYLDRIARTRRAMAEAKLDLLLVSSPENILWLSGYQAKGIFAFQVLIVPADGDVRLVTRAIETGNVVCMPDDAAIDEFVTYGDTSVPTDAAAKLVGERYPRAKRIGVEKINQYFGVTRFEALRDALADAALVDASHLVDKCRLVKSPAEIECFRKAAAISDAAVLEAIKAVRVGVEDREIAAVAMASLIRHGSEYCSTWPNVMVGWRGGLAHAGWDGTKVTAGEPVAIEFAASVQRYHSPLFRTVIPGEPDKEIRRAAECAVRAHDAGLAVLKPGITIDALDRAIRAVVVEMDCAKYAHSRFGYTIGVAFPPTWAQSMPVNIVPGGQTVFEPNMMFHVMVYLLDPASFGIGVSETVRITETGIECLTKSAKAPMYA